MTTTLNPAADKIAIKKRSSRWARLLAALFVALIALLIAIPIALKQGLQYWLSEQTQREVTIAEVKLNLLNGTLSLRQLRILQSSDSTPAQASTPPSQPISSLGYGRITIDWPTLLDGEILIKEILLNRAEVTIERSGKQLHIAGIPLPATAQSEQPIAGEITASSLGVTVAAIKLESITLNYLSDEIDTRVEISNTTFENITTTDPNNAVRIALNLAIDNGVIRYQGEITPFAAEPTVNGELLITDLNLTPFLALVPPDDFTFNHLNLSLQGIIDGTLPQDTPPRIGLSVDATLNELDLVSTLHRNTIIKAATVELNKINVQYPTAVTIDEIVISDLDATLYRDSDGALFSSQQESTAQAITTAEKETATPLAFALDNLSIQGNSTLLFRDATVVPEFHIRLQPLTLTVGRIDNRQQGAETPLSLSANINGRSSIKLDGHISPLAEEMVLTLNSNLSDLELPALSPYTEEHIGYQLRRGRLSAETILTIKKGKIGAKNSLSLANLSVKESNHEKAKGLIEQLEMPLDSVLDLLRDGENNIVFDLPVEGRLDDPQFKLDGVVRLALGRGMKMAAMNYLTNAFQPLGTLMLVGKIVGKVIRPRFQPLIFAAATPELTAETLTYLDKIGTLLKQRPKLTLTLCGIATGDDRAALATTEQATDTEQSMEQQLHTLAEVRAANTRRYLINQHNIDNARLFECNPEMTAQKEEQENRVAGVDIIL